MNRTKIFIISIFLSVAIFLGLIFVEKSCVKYTPTVKVVYCIKDINRKEPLKPEYFTLKDVPITSINMDTVKDIDSIKNMYAKENIYINEPLNKKRIGNINESESYILNSGEREMTISFDDIANCVGGTLRKDDKVDIILTSSDGSGIKTETKFQGIRILGAIDSSGKYLETTRKDIPATILMIAVSPEQGHILKNVIDTGKISLLKVPYADKNYNHIKVINGIVIEK